MASVDNLERVQDLEKLEAIQRTSRDLLAREWSTAAVRALIGDPAGFSPGLWEQIARVGWPGVLVPEALGGSAASVSEFCAIAEELGRALAYAPLVAGVTATAALMRAESGDLRDRMLSQLASGERLAVFADLEHGGNAGAPAAATHAVPVERGFQLQGTKLFVPYAGSADYLLVTATLPPADEAAIFVIDRHTPGVEVRPFALLDWSAYAEVAFSDAVAPHDHLLATGAQAHSLIAETRRLVALATCVELVGVAEAALGIGVEYARNRVAFGRTIGTFQAVKHPLVNFKTDIEVGRALCYRAAQQIESAAAERAEAVALAVFWCGTSLRRVAEGVLQVLGGIGFTWEHDIHLFLRRSATLTAMLGTLSGERALLADSLRQRFPLAASGTAVGTTEA